MSPDRNELQSGDVIEITDAPAGWSFADAIGDIVDNPDICLPTTVVFKGDAYDAIHGLCVKGIQDENFPDSGAIYSLTTKGTVVEEGVNIKVLSFEGGKMKVSVKCHLADPADCDLDAAQAPITNIIFEVEGKEFQFKPNGNIKFQTDALGPDGVLAIHLDGNGSVDIILGDVLLGTLTGQDAEGSLDVVKDIVGIAKQVNAEIGGALSVNPDISPDAGGDLDLSLNFGDNGDFDPLPVAEGLDLKHVASVDNGDGGCNTSVEAGPNQLPLMIVLVMVMIGMRSKDLIAAGFDASLVRVAEIWHKATKSE
ncbi:hypothetical protein JKY72_04080 [Candidatus Gracilibacteria bacterium]|nr:hypothetical protein [Candidatus Gracilibacteria bacterium]